MVLFIRFISSNNKDLYNVFFFFCLFLMFCFCFVFVLFLFFGFGFVFCFCFFFFISFSKKSIFLSEATLLRLFLLPLFFLNNQKHPLGEFQDEVPLKIEREDE